ncbi:adenylyltransferase/cytidyltransferase family protein [Pleionea litopenaei]|uniref:nicotinate-nucleotide adenylyltransferase n=1 Tax=Pleionea litopenaei TaxID=3070815 RepID=A0AA51RQT9_9GAMM|nr:adenylyltransferase/cytidyltransferase family protein [Pleionea sp. HL-JVS1]WMS85905.1 adenylyltransferase/cytidyltransferase family protein [Pleionea sp. HL-JVS1]
MKIKRVGVLGSAFNPPHLGHKDILNQVNHEFDELLLVPSFRHAFAKTMVPFADRLAMVSIMAQAYYLEATMHNRSLTPVLVSDIERRLGEKTNSPVYTYHVLEALEDCYKRAGEMVELVFILGPDNVSFDTWSKFYKADEIRKRWSLRSVSERIKIHSSDIRTLIANYPRPEKLFKARFNRFMDNPVADYIFQQKLYGAQK